MVIAAVHHHATRATALHLEAVTLQAEVAVEAQQVHSALPVEVDVPVLAEALAVVADTRQAVAVVAVVVEEADVNASRLKQKGM
jgi:hypothetical protein